MRLKYYIFLFYRDSLTRLTAERLRLTETSKTDSANWLKVTAQDSYSPVLFTLAATCMDVYVLACLSGAIISLILDLLLSAQSHSALTHLSLFIPHLSLFITRTYLQERESLIANADDRVAALRDEREGTADRYCCCYCSCNHHVSFTLLQRCVLSNHLIKCYTADYLYILIYQSHSPPLN